MFFMILPAEGTTETSGKCLIYKTLGARGFKRFL